MSGGYNYYDHSGSSQELIGPRHRLPIIAAPRPPITSHSIPSTNAQASQPPWMIKHGEMIFFFELWYVYCTHWLCNLQLEYRGGMGYFVFSFCSKKISYFSRLQNWRVDSQILFKIWVSPVISGDSDDFLGRFDSLPWRKKIRLSIELRKHLRVYVDFLPGSTMIRIKVDSNPDSFANKFELMLRFESNDWVVRIKSLKI